MNYLKFSAFCIALFTFNFISSGQEDLNRKYKDLLNSSETFNQYKVIVTTDLDAFWSEVMDSLKQDDQSILVLQNQVATQRVAIDTLTTAKQSVEEELKASLNANDSISFLGISFTKLGYHIAVWAIILVILVLGLIAYYMFIKSNKITSRSKKELETLQLAYEEHKAKSREKEIKLKRELQTAINSLEETKRTRA